MMRVRFCACPACGDGDLHPLGALGNMEYYRCRNCGAEVRREKKARRKKK